MTRSTTYQPGTRLRSQACSTEVIVVRTGAGAVDLTCGGHPMIELGVDAASLPAAPGLDTGTEIGKRYTAEADPTVEVLVTKPGIGTLADGSTPLQVKRAHAFPASD